MVDMNELRFDPSQYEVRTVEIDGRSVTFRAFEGIQYCANPKDPIQKLNIFAPEAYFHGETIHGYSMNTAPIFMPFLSGGYLPGVADVPGVGFKGWANGAFEALLHGYVAACAGVRGRTSGEKSREFFVGTDTAYTGEATGKRVGKAPALIVDAKAAIRYLRANADLIPGNPERIVTNGISASGALSAMIGATGNHPDYEPYLEEIGALPGRDDIFAANCYCPINNLENSDTAYEWLFCGVDEFHGDRMEKTDHGIVHHPFVERMTNKQIALSHELKALFPAYLNSLGLKDESGNALTLDADGNGSFKAHCERYIIASAQHELDTHEIVDRYRKAMVEGSEVEKQPYLTIEGGKVTGIDFECFARTITRMKKTPAFDALDLTSPENNEFGNSDTASRHFTPFSHENSEVGGGMAEPEIIKMINPTRYIRDPEADKAPHWRIRHGVYDRDTSVAIQVILATMLKNGGYDVDFEFPWGIPHSGDFEFDKLFAWIDEKAKAANQ